LFVYNNINVYINRWATDIDKLFNPPPLHFIPKHISIDDLEYLISIIKIINKYELKLKFY
jgi:hypothetical protein